MTKLKVIMLLSILVLLSSCYGRMTPPQSQNPVNPERLILHGDTIQDIGSNVMVIYQDQKNTYWLGSWDNGVYRYDGTTLINITSDHGLSSDRVDEIKEDSHGNLYFISCHPLSTVSKYDGKSFETLSAVPSDEWRLQSTDLWFRHAYQNEKVYRYDGRILHELSLPKPPHLSNPFEIYSIYQDLKGNIWFGTNPVGVCQYNGTTFNWITEEDVTEFRNEGANGVRSITEDHNGDFWFNTEYRYSIYDSTTLQSGEFYHRHKSIGGLDGVEDSNLDEYLSTVMDDNNNLWFVTYRHGVWKYDGTTITNYAVENNGEGITLFSIYKDNSGNLWLGTHDNGAYQFNGATFERFKP